MFAQINSLLLYLLLIKPLSCLWRVPGYALVSILSSTRIALIVFTVALEKGKPDMSMSYAMLCFSHIRPSAVNNILENKKLITSTHPISSCFPSQIKLSSFENSSSDQK